MDHSLSGDRLVEERAFIKRYSEGLAPHKVEYKADFDTPLQDRPRKVNVIGVPIADPPDIMDVDSAPSQDASITLTIKSLKPSLSLSVTAQRTDTVADLKSLISKASSSAPPADSQRLLLKGKALTESKLLKEYDIDNGAIVHLLLKPSAVNTDKTGGAETSSHARTPSLTITTSVDDDSKPGTEIPVTDRDIDVPPLGPQPQVSSATFHSTISDTAFWQKIHALCVTEFALEDDADAAWNVFLLSMKGRLSAGEAAKIRDVVGIAGMGGGAL